MVVETFETANGTKKHTVGFENGSEGPYRELNRCSPMGGNKNKKQD